MLVKTLGVLLLICGLATVGYGEDKEIEFVKSVLNAPRRDWGKMPWQEHAIDLKPLQDRAIPLLATLLTDRAFSYHAGHTMLVIDPDKAAPLLFALMPRIDPNVQRDTFRFFIRRIYSDGDRTHASMMHAAAVRCLKADASGDELIQALLAVGLTGNEADFPLLEAVYRNNDPTEVWRLKYQATAQAALARLGHPKHLENIETELSAPVASPIPEARAFALERVIRSAGFSGKRRFVPLLVRHLDDPRADIPRSDVSPPSPAWAAASALEQIINNTHTDDSGLPKKHTDWRQWWSENKHTFHE